LVINWLLNWLSILMMPMTSESYSENNGIINSRIFSSYNFRRSRRLSLRYLVCNLRVFYVVYLQGLGKSKPSGIWFPHRNGFYHILDFVLSLLWIDACCMWNGQWLFPPELSAEISSYWKISYLRLSSKVPLKRT
jgi:hypothetical protein